MLPLLLLMAQLFNLQAGVRFTESFKEGCSRYCCCLFSSLCFQPSWIKRQFMSFSPEDDLPLTSLHDPPPPPPPPSSSSQPRRLQQTHRSLSVAPTAPPPSSSPGHQITLMSRSSSHPLRTSASLHINPSSAGGWSGSGGGGQRMPRSYSEALTLGSLSGCTTYRVDHHPR